MGLASVRVDTAPLYERPSADSLRLDEVLYGMSVQVIQESDTGWCYLRTEHRTEGYAPIGCLLTDPEVAAAWRKYKKMVTLAPYIDVQSASQTEAPKVVSVPRGGILVALGTAGIDGWQKVGMVDGAVGYTRASYMGEAITDWQAIPEDDMRWNLVETALSYNGAALRTGGRTPMGIDAMGLIAMSYLLNGVVVPHTPGFRQGDVIHQVPEGRMGEGDILFFRSSAGIYMGEDKFVHATDLAGGEGVVVSSLNSRDENYRGDLAGQIVAVAGLY